MDLFALARGRGKGNSKGKGSLGPYAAPMPLMMPVMPGANGPEGPYAAMPVMMPCYGYAPVAPCTPMMMMMPPVSGPTFSSGPALPGSAHELAGSTVVIEEIAPSAPSRTAPPLEPFKGLHGRIKSFEVRKSFGFVECSYLRDRRMGDAYLDAAGMAPFTVGDCVLFDANFDDKGRPRAKHLMGLCDLEGWIKSFSEDKKFGFIQNDAISQRLGCDVFLLATHKGSFAVGSKVRFSVSFTEGNKPQAFDLKAAPDSAWTEEESPPTGEVSVGSDIPETLEGTIKSFDAANGYGFIECPYLRSVDIMLDAFLHKSQLGDFQVGSEVQFSVHFRQGRPQASDLRAVGAPALAEEQEMPQSPPRDLDATADLPERLAGNIKSFNDVKGFGFIECGLLKDRGMKDVFLHKSQIGSLGVGSAVSFTVSFKNGRPQASDVQGIEPPTDPASPTKCAVCLSGDVAVLYIECGHACLCIDCSDNGNAAQLRRCPICRQLGERKPFFFS